MVHHDVCPLCSSEDPAQLFRCTDHFISGEEFPVFRCRNCGFTYTNDHPGEDEAGRYYESEDYISHSDTSKGIVNKLYLFARKFMLVRKRSFIEKTTGLKSGSLLDIGSGTGYFAATMKNAGWQVKGIEISEKARTFSSSHFNIEVLPPSELDSIESDSLDCITLWHVLEHFHDPFKYISEIKRILKPGALCIIALPNCSSYDAEYYDRYWAAWDVPRHLWHFSPATFNIFAGKAGFRNERISILPLDVFYISQLSEKYKGSSFPFLTGLIKAKYFTIKTFFNREKASSVIYTLQKPLS
jgi:SAM-dependent methyltransferase